MKKIWIFLFSSLIAFGIAVYSKKAPVNYSYNRPSWKTFEKKSSNEIAVHQTTGKELEQARIPTPKRTIASLKENDKNENLHHPMLPKDRNYQLREDRVLMGDVEKNNYQDESVELEMVNRVNPDWKNILGNDLLRFQEEDTKVMVKDEFPIIKIQNGKGLYLEQVIVTFVFKNGSTSSYHALVDSDTGFVTETWDKTVSEKVSAQGSGITLPEVNNSGITTR
jgi:hypothetical protein